MADTPIERLSQELDGLRRREQELVALYETAGDLSSMRDVEQVLRAIVRRARGLLGSDLAWITLIDAEEGDIYVRVTEGAITPEFEHLRLALGAGLGGVVAKTGTPYATRDYTADPRIVHERPMRGALVQEGLVAVLGVPLKVGGAVIGVLYAGDRRERSFAQHDVALLGSLATHAAIALHNARLFEEAREAVSSLARLTTVDERLIAVALEGGDLEGFVRTLSALAECPVALDDADGRLLARWPPAAEPGALAVTVAVGSRRLGSLRAGEGQGHAPVVERAALVAGVILLNRDAVADAEQRVRGEVVEDLLLRRQEDAALSRRARAVGAQLGGPCTVSVAAPAGDGARALIAARNAAGRGGGLAGQHAGRLVVVLPGTDASGAGERLHRALGAGSTVATAQADGGPGAVRAAHAEAAETLRALLSLGRTGTSGTPTQLGLLRPLAGAVDAGDLDAFLVDCLGSVEGYDARHRTGLLGTLEAYFDASGNVTRAAAALHVHPNTLYQRLARIGSLLGADWSEPDRALQLHLALRLRRLRQSS